MSIRLLRKLKRSIIQKRTHAEELRRFQEARGINANKPIKVTIGSAGICERDWLPTERHFLDLLKESDWRRFFEQNSIQNIVAEHVWEHLTLEQGLIAARTTFKFLKKGGRLRVAVPDGHHNDQGYIDAVRPGGHGVGSDDHQVLYTLETLRDVFEKAGFQVTALEYFDEEKCFHASDWNEDEGFIRRSLRYDPRNKDGLPKYSSLIIDAIKA